MELSTLDRSYKKQNIIDEFESIIWTERFYGDGDFELVVSVTDKIFEKLPLGVFLSLTGSNELMILETMDIQDKKVTFKGISLLSWLNNRFIRVSDNHKDNKWYFEPQPVGTILWVMVSEMCTATSPYLNGDLPIDIPVEYLERLVIPGLGLREYDSSGGNVPIVAPFGPLYDAMREIAVTYQIGMQILFTENPDSEFPLGFRNYKGLDRTTRQSANPVVRFSPYLESLTDVKELKSISGSKNLVFSFASEVDDSLSGSGIAHTSGTETSSGFDLRAEEMFVDITADQPDTDIIVLLNAQARNSLDNNRIVNAVDGQIVPTHLFKYGEHYNLGDLVEVQGYSGTINIGRVTEYIRTQSDAGEKEYPTVTILDAGSIT
jgi:hypothetical protein